MNYNEKRADEMSEKEIEMIKDEGNEERQQEMEMKELVLLRKSKGRRNPAYGMK